MANIDLHEASHDETWVIWDGCPVGRIREVGSLRWVAITNALDAPLLLERTVHSTRQDAVRAIISRSIAMHEPVFV